MVNRDYNYIKSKATRMVSYLPVDTSNVNDIQCILSHSGIRVLAMQILLVAIVTYV